MDKAHKERMKALEDLKELSKPLERVIVFIDGGYLRRTFNDLFGDDNIDYGKMLDGLLGLYNSLPSNPFRADLIRAYYYDGIVSEEEDEFRQQKEYFYLVTNHFFFTLRLGRLIKSSKKKFRQKGVDVLMAIDALTMAYQNHYDTGIFFMEDRDFIPLIEAVKQAGKKTIVVFYGLKGSDELRRAFDVRIVLDKDSMRPWHSN